MNIKHHFKKILVYIFWFFIAILLAVCLRVFLFSPFSIPSQSMSPAIEAGDHILINKLIPGARIIKNYDFLDKGGRPDMWRLKGYRDVRRNDILVFNMPYNKKNGLHPNINEHYIKRCVALPGDTFYIDNGIYKVNGVSGKLGNYEAQQNLSQWKDQDIPQGGFQCFPKRNKFYHWTMKNFGPLYVPRQNDCLNIDFVNIALYKIMIEYETGGKIRIVDEKVSLNDSIITHYTFDLNYYFMAGDNVLDSKDSRYWGVLPEDHIVGKAFVIYKSNDLETKVFRWNRFLKAIE